MDFVVGIEIRLSGNHTCDGKIFYDICDELKGKYPKDFKFTGWHPQCRCYAVSILKTDKELDKDFDRMLEGEEPMSAEESKNAVEDVPKQFKDWVEENKKKINTAKSLPYFVKDNRRAVDRIIKKEKISELSPHYGNALKLGRNAKKEAYEIIQNIGSPILNDLQKSNLYELAAALGLPKSQIQAMDYLEADSGKSNPSGNKLNCQSVVVAFEARRRGLKVYAPKYNPKDKAIFELGENFERAFLSAKNGKPISPTILRGRNDEEIIKKTEKQLNTPGRYVLGINYKDGSGHVLSIDIIKDMKIILHDEQINEFGKLQDLENIDYLEIIRIDNALLNINLLKSILLI